MKIIKVHWLGGNLGHMVTCISHSHVPTSYVPKGPHLVWPFTSASIGSWKFQSPLTQAHLGGQSVQWLAWEWESEKFPKLGRDSNPIVTTAVYQRLDWSWHIKILLLVGWARWLQLAQANMFQPYWNMMGTWKISKSQFDWVPPVTIGAGTQQVGGDLKPVVTTAVYQRLDWSRHIKKIIKTWRTRTHSSANGRAGFAHTGVHDKGGGFMYVKFSPAAAADGAGPGRQGTLKNFGHKKN